MARVQRGTHTTSVELVADRFVVADEARCRTSTSARALDLATGHEVLLALHEPDALPQDRAVAAAQRAADTAWAARCDWFHRLSHRAIAPLVDYGAWGASGRFEAWRFTAPSHDSSTAHENRGAVERFLSACGRSTDGMATAEVQTGGEGRLLLPVGAGFELQMPGSDDRAAADEGVRRLPLVDRGVRHVDRQELRGLADAVVDAAGGRSTAVALWGIEGSGLRTATSDLARAARLQGVVPLAVSVAARAGPALRSVLAGRSVLVIDACGDGLGWARLVECARWSPRSHVLLVVGRREVARRGGLGLTRLSEQALLSSVQPAVAPGPDADRLKAWARSAHGLPGRFVARLWDRARVRGLDCTPSATRVAERAPEYGTASALVLPERVEACALAPLEELHRWRQSAEHGAEKIRAGRVACGERELRAAVGKLVRRSDWPAAVTGLLSLAASHLERGRPREAREVLREIDAAPAAAPHVSRFELQCQMAEIGAAALGDLGQVEEAARILTATLVAARGAGDTQRCLSTRLALARSRFWLGEYDDARHLLTGDDPRSSGAMSKPAGVGTARLDVRWLALRSRLEIGRGRPGAAIGDAATAVRLAGVLGEPGPIAAAAQASAFAFLAVGDAAAVDREVARAVAAARAAHDPLRAIKARLLTAEGGARAGRMGAAAWLRRADRVAGRRLPATVAARMAILLDESGLARSEVVRRRISATGLRALALFHAVGEGSGAGAREGGLEARAMPEAMSGVMEDVLDLLRCCQGPEEGGGALARVVCLMRERLRATGVGCYLETSGGSPAGAPILVAVDGRRPSPDIAARVLAAQQPIAPHPSGAATEGGSPVRFEGRVLGAFVARWSIGAEFDAPRAGALLSAAATAAAPAVAAVVHRRWTPSRSETDDLLGISQAMHDVRRAIERAATAPYAVLIEGESGSGKELVARAVHRRSQRKDRPFCALNCAALPEDLLEAELFGHVRGAFTGAMTDRLGVFEAADGGTVLLDEIGELSPRAQAKLLRTIQEGEIRRVGENLSRRIDVRIVAATNRTLRQEVAAGRFRADLLYRLDVVRITLTPLRSRREDIPGLVDHYWRDASARVGSSATLSAATVGALSQYDWPGNVRELQNVLAALAVRGPRRGVVPPSALPTTMGATPTEESWRLEEARRTFDERFVRAALVRTGGHRQRAAQELGVSRQGLAKLMTRLGIRDNQDP